MATCYNVMTTNSADQDESKTLTAICDTEVGPNLIREDIRPTPWLKGVRPIHANMKAAGDTTITVKGVVGHQARTGKNVTIAVIGVEPKLATKMTFGTAFIDNEMKRIDTNDQQVAHNGSYAVAILEIFEDEATIQSFRETKR